MFKQIKIYETPIIKILTHTSMIKKHSKLFASILFVPSAARKKNATKIKKN